MIQYGLHFEKINRAFANRISQTYVQNLIIISFRYGGLFKNIAGESNYVTEEVAAPWTEITLPTILSRYSPEDIFSA